jgi:hypothetical protein
MAFDHEKLDVYQRAMDFAVVASALCEALPRGKGYLADQLQRAALRVRHEISRSTSFVIPAKAGTQAGHNLL